MANRLSDSLQGVEQLIPGRLGGAHRAPPVMPSFFV
jgi:hypothetical protein